MSINDKAKLFIFTLFKIRLTNTSKLTFSYCNLSSSYSIMKPNVTRLINDLTNEMIATMIHKTFEIGLVTVTVYGYDRIMYGYLTGTCRQVVVPYMAYQKLLTVWYGQYDGRMTVYTAVRCTIFA